MMNNKNFIQVTQILSDIPTNPQPRDNDQLQNENLLPLF